MTAPNAISIVIPVRNMPAHIGPCIESLVGQLVEGDEIVVVDDGSTDDTGSVADAGGARVVSSTSSGGPYQARNLGAAQSVAPSLLFVDARCRALPGLLDAHRALLADSVLSCTRVDLVAGRGLAPRIAVVQDAFGLESKVRGSAFDFYPTANLGVRRDVFDQVGGFRRIRSGADADFCWRVQLGGLGSLAADRRALMRWIPRDRVRDLVEQTYRYGRSSVYLDKLYSAARAAVPEGQTSPTDDVGDLSDGDSAAAWGARGINLAFRVGRLRGRWEHRSVQPDLSLIPSQG